MAAVAAMWATEAVWMELNIDGTVTVVGGTPIDATAGSTPVHPVPGGNGAVRISLPGPLAADAVGGFEVNLDAIRREAANADAPEHGVMPRSVARW